MSWPSAYQVTLDPGVAGKEGELVNSQNSSCPFTPPSHLGGPSGAKYRTTLELQKPQEGTAMPKKILRPTANILHLASPSRR